ncbi:MAG: nucleotidyltransferase domain-containing protein [Candidatus Aminicenantaceae bacterium]
MRDKIISIIKEILQTNETIEFVYVFGSFLSEKDYSDIDIGIYLSQEMDENILYITSNMKHKISRRLKESNILIEADRIDITLLNSVDFMFEYHVFKEGLLILDRNSEHRTELIEKNSIKVRECMGILKEAEIL